MSYKTLIKNRLKSQAAMESEDIEKLRDTSTTDKELSDLFKKYKKNFEAHKLLAAHPNTSLVVIEKLKNSPSAIVKEIANRRGGRPVEHPSRVVKPTPTFTPVPNKTPSEEPTGYRKLKATDPDLAYPSDYIKKGWNGLKIGEYSNGQPALTLFVKFEDVEDWNDAEKKVITSPVKWEGEIPNDIFLVKAHQFDAQFMEEILNNGWFEVVGKDQVPKFTEPDMFNDLEIWKLRQ